MMIMKILKIMIVMLLLIMSAGAVCAADDINDESISYDVKTHWKLRKIKFIRQVNLHSLN